MDMAISYLIILVCICYLTHIPCLEILLMKRMIVHTTLLKVIEGLMGNILQAILGWKRWCATLLLCPWRREWELSKAQLLDAWTVSINYLYFTFLSGCTLRSYTYHFWYLGSSWTIGQDSGNENAYFIIEAKLANNVLWSALRILVCDWFLWTLLIDSYLYLCYYPCW